MPIATVGAVNDYQKKKQFRDLNAKKDDVTVTVNFFITIEPVVE